MPLLGINAKCYRNTSSYGAPNWSEITQISDLSINPTWDKGDASARESRIKQNVKTMMDLEITAKVKKRIGDANYEAIMDALVSDNVLDLLVLDASKETVGARGWRIDAQIFSATEDQAMGNVLYEDITISPSLESNPPKAVKVGAGPALTYSTPGANGASFS